MTEPKTIADVLNEIRRQHGQYTIDARRLRQDGHRLSADRACDKAEALGHLHETILTWVTP